MHFALRAGLGLLAGAFAIQAQAPRVSPRDVARFVIGGNPVVIEYSRPSLKGRKLTNLAPYGKIWRTGADEATTLVCLGDVVLGSLKVPAGAYSLFTIPGEEEWTLIVNRVARQWGDSTYDKRKDLGRVRMKVASTTAWVEQFTIAIVAAGEAGALKISWGSVEASIPVTAP